MLLQPVIVNREVPPVRHEGPQVTMERHQGRCAGLEGWGRGRSSPPRVNAELAAIYQAKLATHPGATADERMRLLAEARAPTEG
jgi:hypothetical protein